MSAISRLIEGSIDIHVHFGPDPLRERRADAIEVAQRAREMGMRGLVLKSHHFSTVPVAYTVSRVVPGLEVMGGLCLDVGVGGLNSLAVENTAKMGGKVIWMPTLSAAAFREYQNQRGGVTICDRAGKLRPEVYTILETIKQYNLVLATGHVSPKESLTLVEEARSLGLYRIVVTHASHLHYWYGMTVDQMKELARLGALIEHSAYVMTAHELAMKPKALAEMIREIGAENCIFSTDYGQAFSPIAPEGMRMGIAALLAQGMEDVEVGLMVKDNPARLLGL
jgi:L-amino acid N-acyltransferase YncA